VSGWGGCPFEKFSLSFVSGGENMPVFERGPISLYYEEYGPNHAYPLLLIAPGGMRSHGGFWHTSPFDPTVELADEFRVIAMDQRNAGRSRGPIDPEDGWPTYRDDQLALLDQLGIGRCHVMGGCIGCSYGLALVEAAPDRITAAVLQNPIGISQGNRPAFEGMFDEWAAELLRLRSDLDAPVLRGFGERMFGGEFVFSVTRDAVRASRTPLLVLAGDDNFHPTATAEEITQLAPRAELVLIWKTPDIIRQTVERVRTFLRAHSPG
jgi:pimeloyl-ACP methyl ester carboxylesterase